MNLVSCGVEGAGVLLEDLAEEVGHDALRLHVLLAIVLLIEQVGGPLRVEGDKALFDAVEGRRFDDRRIVDRASRVRGLA